MSALGQKRTHALQQRMLLRANSGHRGDYERSGCDAAARGKVSLISVNSSGCVSTSTEPPCCFTMMSWLIERPNPVPSPGGLVVKNDPKVLGRGREPRLVIATVEVRFTLRASVKSVRD